MDELPSRAIELGHDQVQEIVAILNERLDTDTPDGTWWPNLRIVQLLRVNLWQKLSATVKIKLENLIVNDILSGRHDIHSSINKSGSLGTYAVSFWKSFRNKEALVSNIEAMLKQSWFTQNYIGNNFMARLPRIASSTEHRARIISALRVAIRNDARIVQNKLSELPDDWVIEIRTVDEDEGPEYS